VRVGHILYDPSEAPTGKEDLGSKIEVDTERQVLTSCVTSQSKPSPEAFLQNIAPTKHRLLPMGPI
jgi:hypothetical protein